MYKELKTYEGCDDNYITLESQFKNHASVINLKHCFFSNKVITISKESYCNRIYRLHRIARKANRLKNNLQYFKNFKKYLFFTYVLFTPEDIKIK